FGVAHDWHVFSVAIGAAITGSGGVRVAPHDEQNLFAAALAVSHAAHTTGGNVGIGGAAGAAFGASCTALRNSRIDLPTAPLTLVRRPAPKMITRTTRTMSTSQGPKPIRPNFLRLRRGQEHRPSRSNRQTLSYR